MSLSLPTWLAPVDLFGSVLVLLLLVMGLVRGLWWQVIRLVGVVLAVLAARILGASLAGMISGFWPELSSRASHGAAWATIFLLTLGAASLLGLFGQRVLEAMKLGLANRAAGALAGAATGVLVHVALVVVLCQLAPPLFVGRYVAGTFSERLYAEVAQRWPGVLGVEAAQEVERVLAPEGAPARGPVQPPEPEVHPSPAEPTNVVR